MEHNLSDRIAIARKQAGLTQEQLGEKLGVSRQAVSKWEGGQTTPDLAYVIEMCRLFGVSSDWLLLGVEDARETAPARCPGCQRIVTGLDKYCPNCGRPLQGDAPARYTLLLQPSHFPGDCSSALRRLSAVSWITEGSPLFQLSPQGADQLRDSAPVVLARGLTAAQAREALSIFEYRDPNCLEVHPDQDGAQAGEIAQSPSLSRAQLPEEPERPMTFGATVGAVILGVIGAILLLSFL